MNHFKLPSSDQANYCYSTSRLARWGQYLPSYIYRSDLTSLWFSHNKLRMMIRLLWWPSYFFGRRRESFNQFSYFPIIIIIRLGTREVLYYQGYNEIHAYKIDRELKIGEHRKTPSYKIFFSGFLLLSVLSMIWIINTRTRRSFLLHFSFWYFNLNRIKTTISK